MCQERDRALRRGLCTLKEKMNITPSQMANYRAKAQLRQQQEQKQLNLRRERAWEVALQAAKLLKEQFAATEVILFGSVLNPKHFHQRSDIDLAVWGLEESRYLRALACLLDLDYQFEVDLVMAQETRPTLLATIIATGTRS